MIIVKDNMSTDLFLIDKDDYSIVRDDKHYKKIFEKAELNIILEKEFEELKHLPQNLYTVKIYAMR